MLPCSRGSSLVLLCLESQAVGVCAKLVVSRPQELDCGNHGESQPSGVFLLPSRLGCAGDFWFQSLAGIVI